MKRSVYAVTIEGLGLTDGDVEGTANQTPYDPSPLMLTESMGAVGYMPTDTGDFTYVDCLEESGGEMAEEVDLVQMDSARSGRTLQIAPVSAVEKYFLLSNKDTFGVVRYNSIGDPAFASIDLHVPEESLTNGLIKIVYIQSSVMRITSIVGIEDGIAQVQWTPIFGTSHPDLLSGYDDRVVYQANQTVQGRMVKLYIYNPNAEEIELRWTGYITSADTDESTGLISVECAGSPGSTNRASFGSGAPTGVVKLTRHSHEYGRIAVSATFNTEEFYPREYFPVGGSILKGLFIPIVADRVVTYLQWPGSVFMSHNNILHGDSRAVKPDITASEAEPSFARAVVSTAPRVMELGGQIKDENGAASDHFIDIALNLLMSSGTYFSQWGGGGNAGKPVDATSPGKNGSWDWLPAWAGMNVKESEIDVDSFLSFRTTYPFSDVRLNNFLAGHKEEKFSEIMKGVLGSAGCFLTERNGKMAVASFAMSFFNLFPKVIGDDDVTVEDIRATNPDSLSGAVSSISLRCGDDFPSGSHRHTVTNTDLSLSTRRRYGAQERRVDLSLPYLGMPDTGRIPDDVLEAVRIIHGLMYSALTKESYTIELLAEPDFDVAVGDCFRVNLTTTLCGGFANSLGFVYSFSESMESRAIRLRIRLVDKASFGALVSPSFLVSAAASGTTTISDTGYGSASRLLFKYLFDSGMRKFEVGDISAGGNRGVVSLHEFTGYNQSTGVLSGVSPVLTMPSANTLVVRLAPADSEMLDEFAYIGSANGGLDGREYTRWAL